MNKRHTRRNVLASTAAGAGTLLAAGTFPEFLLAQTALPASAEVLQVPSWDAVPSCSPSNTDRAGQGPFFIHNDERANDIDLFRQDIRGQYDPQAEPGTELQMHFRVLDNSGGGQCSDAPS